MCCVFAAVYSVLLRSRTSSLLLCSHSSDPFAVSSRVSISVGKYLHWFISVTVPGICHSQRCHGCLYARFTSRAAPPIIGTLPKLIYWRWVWVSCVPSSDRRLCYFLSRCFGAWHVLASTRVTNRRKVALFGERRLLTMVRWRVVCYVCMDKDLVEGYASDRDSWGEFKFDWRSALLFHFRSPLIQAKLCQEQRW